jgi:hypothetical protein
MDDPGGRYNLPHLEADAAISEKITYPPSRIALWLLCAVLVRMPRMMPCPRIRAVELPSLREGGTIDGGSVRWTSCSDGRAMMRDPDT